MPSLADSSVCTGCSACRASCPHDAIWMKPDHDGFLHPTVDARKCAGCGLCEQACPVLHPEEPRNPLRVLAVRAKDDGLRRNSSSGGVFSLLARRVLERGGSAFGAAFDPSDWHVRHIKAENEENLQALRGSKYVQSDAGDTYHSALDLLKAGRTVLFSGTPCQIAGFDRFLGVSAPGLDRNNLLLVDMACHGVTSPLVWRRYLRDRMKGLSRTGARIRPSDLSSVSFRDKATGWHVFSVSIRTKDSRTYRKDIFSDTFMRAFLKELLSRPSCFKCPFRNFRSEADVTLADYWSVQKLFPDMDDNKGTSLVLATTERGLRSIAAVEPECVCRESDLDHALAGNPVLVRSLVPNPMRRRFFRFVRWIPFDCLVNHFLGAPEMPMPRSGKRACK